MTRHALWASTIAVAVLLAAACGQDEAPPPAVQIAEGRILLSPEQISSASVRVEAVVLRSVTREIDVPGTIASPDTATAAVASLVEGRVESVAVVPGDAVREGAPLVRIHSHELTDALRDLTTAEARLAYAEAALARSQELLEAGAVAREEEQRRRAERDAQAAELARAREWVSHLSPEAEGLVVVRAPRTGVVFEVAVRPGSGVMPGSPLVTLGRTDVLWVTAWIPEREFVRVAPGDTVSVRLPTLPHLEVQARIVRMGGAIDPVRRAVEVRAEMTVVPAGIRPGAFATLLLPAADAGRHAVLPADAVQRMTTGEAVFIEEGAGLYRPVPVTSFPLPGGEVAVSGLSDGQRVVVSGAYAVRSAMENREEAP